MFICFLCACVCDRLSWEQEIADLRVEMETLCRQAEQASQTVLQDEVNAATSQQTSTRNLTDSVMNHVYYCLTLYFCLCLCEQIAALEMQKELALSQVEDWIADAEKYLNFLRYCV